MVEFGGGLGIGGSGEGIVLNNFWVYFECRVYVDALIIVGKMGSGEFRGGNSGGVGLAY